jgi:hypothetical protein
MIKQTRKNFRKSLNKSRRVRKHRGGGGLNCTETICEENYWHEQRVDKTIGYYNVTVYGGHDFSKACKEYTGIKNCLSCLYCGKECTWS